ncbi:hypothetical protein ACS0TY_025526 [Phlomoides rotata]
MCGGESESVSHILLRCSVTLNTWGRSPFRLNHNDLVTMDFKSLMWLLMKTLPKYGVCLFVLVTWNLWKAQNRRWKHGKNLEPPAQGKLKLNSDAGVFSDGSVGLGFIVRDETGSLILAGSKRCSVAADNSTMIEALALRFGASSALNHGLHVAMLESDSRNLV